MSCKVSKLVRNTALVNIRGSWQLWSLNSDTLTRGKRRRSSSGAAIFFTSCRSGYNFIVTG